MRRAAVAAGILFAGCAGPPGTAEDFRWSIDCPRIVDKGAEFLFTVRTTTASGAPVEGVSYKFQIHWPGGPVNPIRHFGNSGEPEKMKARMLPGTATLVVTCADRRDLEVQVLETTFQVNGLGAKPAEVK